MNMLESYPEISFIDNMTVEDIQAYYLKAMKEKYKELTGRELVMSEAEPARLIAYANCMILYQIAQYADRAGKMSLLKYSYGDYLDNIGALKGVKRLEAGKAVTTLRFTLSDTRPGVILIPKGTRVTAATGMYFETVDNLEIPAGSLSGEVNAECREAGMDGNGYEAGMLNVIVDPIAYVEKAENITVTQGGSDREDDRNFAERIYLTPSSWSVAGPDDAYIYWVKTFDAAIKDVCVHSEVPGDVEIRFMLQDGEVPGETMIKELENFLKNGDIRPLTDHVNVAAPAVHEYEIEFTYYINSSDIKKITVIQENIVKAVQEYKKWQNKKIGRDINPDKLIALLIEAGAKRVEVSTPEFCALSWEEIAKAVTTQINYGGLEDD